MVSEGEVIFDQRGAPTAPPSMAYTIIAHPDKAGFPLMYSVGTVRSKRLAMPVGDGSVGGKKNRVPSPAPEPRPSQCNAVGGAVPAGPPPRLRRDAGPRRPLRRAQPREQPDGRASQATTDHARKDLSIKTLTSRAAWIKDNCPSNAEQALALMAVAFLAAFRLARRVEPGSMFARRAKSILDLL